MDHTDIAKYYFRNIRMGHTSAMVNGITSDTVVLVPSNAVAQNIKEMLPKGIRPRFVTMHQEHALEGIRAPMVIDHTVVEDLACELNHAKAEISRLRDTILKQRPTGGGET